MKNYRIIHNFFWWHIMVHYQNTCVRVNMPKRYEIFYHLNFNISYKQFSSGKTVRIPRYRMCYRRLSADWYNFWRLAVLMVWNVNFCEEEGFWSFFTVFFVPHCVGIFGSRTLLPMLAHNHNNFHSLVRSICRSARGCKILRFASIDILMWVMGVRGAGRRENSVGRKGKYI